MDFRRISWVFRYFLGDFKHSRLGNPVKHSQTFRGRVQISTLSSGESAAYVPRKSASGVRAHNLRQRRTFDLEVLAEDILVTDFSRKKLRRDGSRVFSVEVSGFILLVLI